MGKFFRYMMVVLLIFCSAGLAAQDTGFLAKMYSDFAQSCVSIGFNYSTVVDGVKVSGQGDVLVQGDAYKMSGSGVEVYCDGKSVWIVDEAAGEVVIESVAEGVDGYMANPALLLARMEEIFEPASVNGRTFVMKPKVDCGISSATLTFSAGGILTTGVFRLEDGTDLNVNIIHMKNTTRKPIADFRPSVKFDDSWVVTDLR